MGDGDNSLQNLRVIPFTPFRIRSSMFSITSDPIRFGAPPGSRSESPFRATGAMHGTEHGARTGTSACLPNVQQTCAGHVSGRSHALACVPLAAESLGSEVASREEGLLLQASHGLTCDGGRKDEGSRAEGLKWICEGCDVHQLFIPCSCKELWAKTIGTKVQVPTKLKISGGEGNMKSCGPCADPFGQL